MLIKKNFFLTVFVFPVLCFALISSPVFLFADPVCFDFSEKILGDGELSFETSINKNDFNFNDNIEIQVRLQVKSRQAIEVIKELDGIYILLRAERIFDKQGRYHQFTNNYNSTVLTPSGLPIENYDFSATEYEDLKFVEYIDSLAPENRFSGYSNSAPFYKYAFAPKSNLKINAEELQANFKFQDIIKTDFPEGYYRFQITALCKKHRYFHRVNFLPLYAKTSSIYSDWDQSIILRTSSYLPVIKVGNPVMPKMIWTLLTKYFSNGTQGVVAKEDADNFQFNSRHIIPAEFILPPLKTPQETTKYILEPDFPTMFAKPLLKLEQGSKWDFQTPIPLNYQSGELSVVVTKPDGTKDILGTEKFQSQSTTGASSNSDKFGYQFSLQGKYSIELTGWISDVWGNTYTGGGTYEVWVANRLTFATSVKPGTPFEVGDGYPPSVIIHPPCPAKVKVDIAFYRNSSKQDIKKVVIEGAANRYGYFYPKEKFEKMIFDCPGEYLSTITAFYTDSQGNFWMGSQKSGSVVAPKNSPLIVHGASPSTHIHADIGPRDNSNYEGQLMTVNNPMSNNYTCCTLFPFPYYSGDILYIANTFSGDNGIRPILTMRCKENLFPGITKGIAPFSTTTNGYQPQGYPEFLDKHSYAYMSAIRPGLTARFMVSQDTHPMGDTYWQSGGNFAGEQINNSYNGDLPQDIYEFLGGVVYRDLKKGINLYGIYASMGVVIPKGSFANRVSAPLAEPIFEINGRKHYLFDAGTPLAGMIFETGDILSAGAMIFPPIANVKCLKKITTPGGKQYEFKGITNKIGLAKMSAAEGAEIPIQEPGVYTVEGNCRYKDKKGDFAGTRDGKYFVYAVEPSAPNDILELNLPARFSINYTDILRIKGAIKTPLRHAKVYYTVIMPGMIMDEGILEVNNEKFSYSFSPQDTAVQFPNYDIISYTNPQAQEMADTVIFTFFLTGTDTADKTRHAVKRFILRGNQGFILN
ncbi:MAG: hypothetical protein HY810_01035 [Candidatus Omnitrophica bacterium]|nr:hypothetical protein [Candidatus Omnitrophota bacterium]